jgi:Coenzyme PQQ synthesis protein D (PqqD)
MKLKINPLVVRATFDNEQVLLHPGTGRFLRLNATAGRLYELLNSGASLEMARDTLLSEFEVTPQELTAEIERIVGLMREEQLLLEDNE